MSMNAVPNDTPPLAEGGEPPYDKGMDRRLTVLETRFDTILPTLATKADIEVLRAEVHVGFEKLRGEFHSEFEKLRGEFRSEFEKLRGEFHRETEKLRGEFRGEMERLRADLFKAIHNNTKFMIGVMVSLFIGVLAVNICMFNAINSRLTSIESKFSATPQSSLPAHPPVAALRPNVNAQ